MKREIITIKSRHDQLLIHATITTPDEDPIAIVHIMPGMTESRFLYDDLQTVLASYGYVAITVDYRGYGQSIDENHPLGHLDDQNGWINNLKDLNLYCQWIREKYRHLPYYIFSHGLGSLVARSYLKRYEYEVNALIISGSPSNRNDLILWNQLANRGIKKDGLRAKATRFINYYFNTLDKSNGLNSWYSNDLNVLKRYNEDPLCKPNFSNAMVKDLVFGFKDVYVNKDWHALKTNMPILFLTGEKDQISKYPKGVLEAQKILMQAGYLSIEQIVYNGKKNNLILGSDNEATYRDILLWYNKITNKFE